MKALLVLISLLLIAISAQAEQNIVVVHTESREQCKARNRSNNQKLEAAGWYVSQETKKIQKEDCAKKKPESRD